MKNKPFGSLAEANPSEDEVRVYAYYLYQQSNGATGHDLDYWLEATACLQANIPAGRSRTRLHQYVNGSENDGPSLLSTEARILAS